MSAQMQTMTREQVMRGIIELARRLPAEKLASWYQYGLFIQSQSVWIPTVKMEQQVSDAELADEFAMWEDASDEDWLKIEAMLKEGG